MGLVGVDEAVALMVEVLGLSDDQARRIVGSGVLESALPKPAPMPPQFSQPEMGEDTGAEDDTDGKSFEDTKHNLRERFRKEHIERYTVAEGALDRRLAEFFRRYYDGVDKGDSGS